MQISDEGILRLLYDEAKYNVLEGRYPCDIEDCELLGGLSCCLELGPYCQEKHTASTLRYGRMYASLFILSYYISCINVPVFQRKISL